VAPTSHLASAAPALAAHEAQHRYKPKALRCQVSIASSGNPMRHPTSDRTSKNIRAFVVTSPFVSSFPLRGDRN
jgi:hypothetical protein